MKIHAVEDKYFHVLKQTCVWTDMMKLIAALRDVNMHKNWINDGELRFNFWFMWGISLHQHF